MLWKFTKEVGDPHARYAPDAFDENIGKEIPFTTEGYDELSTGTIVDVKVHPDGCCAEFTIEIPDGPLATFLQNLRDSNPDRFSLEENPHASGS